MKDCFQRLGKLFRKEELQALRDEAKALGGDQAAAVRAALMQALEDQKEIVAAVREALKPIGSDLQRMASEAGWAQYGGRLIRSGEGANQEEIAMGRAGEVGEVVDRTKWIPNQEWFQKMRQDLSGKEGKPSGLVHQPEVVAAVQKWLRGDKLRKIEQRTINWMIDEAKSQRDAWAEEHGVQLNDDLGLGDLIDEGIQPSGELSGIADLMSQAMERDEAATERAAIQHEGDNDGLIAALKGILEPAPAEGRAEAAPAPAAGEPLELQPQTPEELRARAEAQAAAARQAANEAAAAERKAKREREKKEVAAREAVVIAEREAAKKAEVDAAAANFALGQEPPKPVVKKVSTDEAAGQGGLGFNVEQERAGYNTQQESLELVAAHEWATPNEAREWLSDDRSHGDEVVGEAAVSTDSEGYKDVVGYVSDVLRLAEALRERSATVIKASSQLEQRRAPYNPAQLELAYDHLETRPGTTQTQRDTGIAALRGLSLGDRQAGATLLGSALWKDFSERGGSELIGKQVSGVHDLALLAQILRDPRFETMRVFFTKGGTIVGHTGWTSRLPGVVAFNVEGRLATAGRYARPSDAIAAVDAAIQKRGEGTAARLEQLRQQMAGLEADGYYLMHNHPDGRSNPSTADKLMTYNMASMMDGFLGHVVIDHGEYSFINRDTTTKTVPIPEPQRSIPEVAHDALGTKIGVPGDLLQVGKNLQTKKGFATLIATNAKGEVQALAELPEKSLLYSNDPMTRGRALVRVRRFMERTGSAGYGYVIAENPERFDWLMTRGAIADATDPQGMIARSSKTRPFVTQTQPRSVWRAETERTPYDITKAASRAFDRATGTFQERLSEARDAGLKATARGIVDRIDQALNPLGTLPEQEGYLELRGLAQGKIEIANERVKEMAGPLERASPSDKVEVMAYLTTAGATPNQITDKVTREAAVKAKEAIGAIGDELVEKGMLNAESRELYRDAYLPRLYLKHLLSEADWKAIGAGKKPSDMGYLKMRKDIPEEVRKVLLGEIQDPGYLAGIALAKPVRDMALLDFLGQISEKDGWILPGTVVPFTSTVTGKTTKSTPYFLKEEAARLRKQARYQDAETASKAEAEAKAMDAVADDALEGTTGEHSDYKQMPNTARYGRLRGMFVRAEIYNDLMGINDFLPTEPGWFQNVFGYGGIGTRATQIWKGMKVAMNPPGQVRNFISNAIATQLFAGVPLHMLPTRFFQAVDQIRAGGKHYDIAKKHGIGVSTFATQEIYRMRTDLLDLQKRTRGLNAMGRMHHIGALLMNKSADLYQLSETLFKTMVIIDAMERQKMTESQAVNLANKALFDYSLVGKNVRYARNAPIGIPFLTYQLKVLPRLIETALLHPQRFIPWVALFYGFPMLVASMLGVDDDDLDKLKKAMPEWLQDKGHALVLPYKDDYGRWQVTDLGYYMPWTNWTQLVGHLAGAEGAKALQDTGIFGGPITDIIVALKTGKDPFTGYDIFNKGDPPERQAISLMNYVWGMAMPPFLTDRGLISPMGMLDTAYGGKAVQAMTGTTNKWGEPRSTGEQAMLYLAGINLYGVNPEESRVTNIQKMQREVRDVMQQMRFRLQDRSLDEEQRRDLASKYAEEVTRRVTNMQKYVVESQIPQTLH